MNDISIGTIVTSSYWALKGCNKCPKKTNGLYKDGAKNTN